MLLADGDVGLLDFGSVGRLDQLLREAIQRLLQGIDHADPLAVSDALLEIVPRPEDVDDAQVEGRRQSAAQLGAAGGGAQRPAPAAAAYGHKPFLNRILTICVMRRARASRPRNPRPRTPGSGIDPYGRNASPTTRNNIAARIVHIMASRTNQPSRPSVTPTISASTRCGTPRLAASAIARACRSRSSLRWRSTAATRSEISKTSAARFWWSSLTRGCQ